MLANCWLLADLDGTLISTPHKAQGRYAPLMSSSCYKPLQRWIKHGGNVCVVTTADLRVMEQLYQPLRSCLGSFADYQRWRVEREGGSGTSTHNSTTKSQASSCGGVRHPGTLLLSLYTGAVLYWCTSDRVCALPGYATILHCPSTSALEAWRQKSPTTTTSVSTTISSSSSSSSSSLEGVCVRGTCISASTCREVVAIVEKIYYNFVEDLLRGDGAVMAALKMLSRRYRRMWLALLRYLHVAHAIMVEDKQPSSSSSSSSSMQECTSVEKLVAQDTAEQIAWKLKYLRKRPYFLLVLGIMRVEHVRASIAVGRPDHTSSSSSSSSSAQQQSAIFTKERIMYCLEAEMSATQTTALHPYTERAAALFMHLLGTQELSRSAASRAAHAQRKVADPLAHDDAMAAQIIVLGVPIALFSRYFRPHEACFMRGGVQCMAQPNSVVFAKLGINKSTALRYLLGLNPRTQDSINHHHHNNKKNDDDDGDGVPTFEAAVSSGLAVAMGDNPHLTDYELTVFADVAFISVEKTSQQQQRHERIRRRVQRTREAEVRGEQPLLPDGSPAPSSTALQDMMKRCGPMMDDRLCANIFYVGGEEDGTALFLSELLQQLHVPEESQCSSSSVVVSEQHFQRALRAAQTKAHSSVESSHILSKL